MSETKEGQLAEVIDLETYRNKKSHLIKKKLDELEEMSEVVYDTYSEEEQIGYERFKKLLELLQLGEYETQTEDEE
mgnify:FL=1|tara:strand:+ start:308 stop:535 length:228 start_codon:yes stop_codon:yes gene_type:complete